MVELAGADIGRARAIVVNSVRFAEPFPGHGDPIGPLALNGGSVATGIGSLTLNSDGTAAGNASGQSTLSGSMFLRVGGNLNIGTSNAFTPDLYIGAPEHPHNFGLTKNGLDPSPWREATASQGW